MEFVKFHLVCPVIPDSMTKSLMINQLKPYPMTIITTFSLSSTNPFSFSFSPSSNRFRFIPHCSFQLSTPPQPKHTGAIIIGAGLSGLSAATHLNSHNIPFLLLDSSNSVGGRVRTDSVDGFLLDRGFQIFITAYPEARKVLDYESLNLRKFYSGARVFYGNRFHTVAHPIRHFFDSVKSIANPIGSIKDKLLIGSNIVRVLTKSDQEIFDSDEITTIEMLRKLGFSDSIISTFFRPFFGGIFFDTELETTSRLFDFIFKCLAGGENTLPANGISAIPEQLAARLPTGSVLLNSEAVSIDLNHSESLQSVKLRNGDVLTSELGVIVAVEEPVAVKLLAGKNNKINPVHKKPVRSTVCIYFTANRDQIPLDPVLYLNGSGKGIVNNMFFVTNVAPSYGPPNKALVSVSLIGLFDNESDDDLIDKVVHELSSWFGEEMVRRWKHLRTYRVGFAQPNQSPPTDSKKNPRVEPGLYVCGDYLTSATFDGALVSGRRAAECLLKDRAFTPV
ncbi:unnamed protein product [Lupinus luteus]|uniref:Amine oxidase domain-containing protein n=1 Tax=Lupinus luteus TaxID=3873 RepID=A0AAV1XSA9_LUPLU